MVANFVSAESTFAQDHPDPLGSVWVAKNTAIAQLASTDGHAVLEIPSAAAVSAVAVDNERAVLWIFVSPVLHAYDLGGNELFSVTVPQVGAGRLAVNHGDGSVWLAVGPSLFHYDGNGQHLRTIVHTSAIVALAASSNNDEVWLSSGDTSITAYDGATGNATRVINTGKGNSVRDIEERPEIPVFLVASSKGVRAYGLDGSVGSLVSLSNPLALSRTSFYVWAATSQAVHQIAGGGVRLSVDPFPGNAGVVAIASDHYDSSVWVLSDDGRLAHLDLAGTVRQLLQVSLAGQGRDLAISERERVPPQISVDAPSEGQFVPSRPLFAISYEDFDSSIDEPSLTLNVYGGGQLALSCSQRSGGADCLPANPLWEGLNQVTASVRDRAGNVGTTQRKFTVDLTPPAITFQTPPEGATLSSTYPRLELLLSDSGAGVNSNSLAIRVDGASWNWNCSLEPGRADCTSALPFSLGEHEITATVADLAGNVSAFSTLHIRISAPDTEGPTLTFVSPAEGSVSDNTVPTVRIAYADALSGVDKSSLVVRVNGETLPMACSGGDGTTGTWACSPRTALPAGPVLFAATAADRAGNPSLEITRSFTVAPRETTIEGTVLLPDGSPAAGAEVSVVGVGSGVAYAGADGRFSIPAVPLKAGERMTAVARLTSGGSTLVAVAHNLVPLEGGISDAGVLRLAPLCPQTVGSDFGAPSGPMGELIVFDYGQGPSLYMAKQPFGAETLGDVLRWDGQQWRSIVSGGFLRGAEAMAVFDDGSGSALYVAGSFDFGSGLLFGVMRWRGAGWSLVGGSFDFYMKALAVFDDGTGPALYAGGWFTGGVAKLTGSSWQLVGADLDHVEVLAALDDGSGPALYAGLHENSIGLRRYDGQRWTRVGRDLTSIGSIAVFNDGAGKRLYVTHMTIDTYPAFEVRAWNGRNWVTTLNDDAQGGLVVFDDGDGPALYAGGGSISKYRNGIWSTAGSPLLSGSDLFVGDLGQGPTLYSGSAMGFGKDQWVPSVKGVARLIDGVWSPLERRGFNGQVRATATFDDGRGPSLYVGGDFSLAGGPANYLARWDGSSLVPVANPLLHPVQALAVFDDGSGPAIFVAGGQFSPVAPGYVARLGSNGWTTWSFSGRVDDLQVFDDGTGPALYVGGSFTQAAGVSANRIAKWNGQSWSHVGTGIVGSILDMVVHDDGSGPALFVAGDITTAGGTVANRIARWDGIAWSAVGSGLRGRANSLSSAPNGQSQGLYAGGIFETGTGSSGYVDRWNGTSWSALGDGLGMGEVRSLLWHDDGRGRALWVGGGGLRMSNPVIEPRLLRWDDASWQQALTGDGAILELATFDDRGLGFPSTLFVGGDFLSVGGHSTPFLLRMAARCVDLTAPTVWLTQPSDGTATTSASVVFIGTLSEAATLTLNGSAVTVSQTLSFQHGPVLLTEGPNPFDLVATDGSGNRATRRVTVTRDNVPPQISFVSPVADEIVFTDRPGVVFQLSDVGSGFDISSLSIAGASGSIPVACSSVSGGARCTFAGPLPDGSNTLIATVRDRAGNVSAPAERSFSVIPDATAPSLSITEPAEGATVSSLLPLIRLEYHDATSGVATSTLLLKANGVAFQGTCDPQPDGATCTPTVAFTAGVVTVIAEIRDLAGNRSETARSFVVQAGPPTLRFALPTDGAILETTSPELRLEYSPDADPGSLTMTSDRALAVSCALGTTETICDVTQALVEGVHNLEATVANLQGLRSQPARVAFTVDVAPPTVTFVAPVTGSTVRNGRPVLRLALLDAGAGVDSATLEIREGADLLAGSCSFGASTADCTPLTPLADGSHSLSATVRDRTGKPASPAAVSFSVDTTDATPPSVLVTTPGQVTNTAQATFSGTVSEPATLTIDGNPVSVTQDLAFSYGPVTLSDGQNSFRFVAVDETGNVAALDYAVLLDTIRPSIAFNTPTPGAACPPLGGSIQLAWADTGAGIDHSSLQLRANGQVLVSTCQTSEAGASCSAPLFTGSSVTLTAQVADLAGNVSSATVECLGDPLLLPPAIHVLSPANGAKLAIPTVLIQGQLSKPATLTVDSQAVAVEEDFSFVAGPYALTPGANTFQLVATDLQGGTGQLVYEVSYDNDGPAALVIGQVTAHEETTGSFLLSGSPGSVSLSEPGLVVAVENLDTGYRSAIPVGAGGGFSGLVSAFDGDTLRLAARDAAGNESEPAVLGVSGSVPSVPDPASLAPPLPPSLSTDACDLVRFYWRGEPQTQFGVSDGAVDCGLLAVARGRVLDRSGAPLAGVRVEAVGQSAFGATFTRNDGAFDLALHASNRAVLRFAKPGYGGAQRTLWLRPQQFASLDDVVLVAPDTMTTTIDGGGSGGAQVARGSQVSDADGARQTTLLFSSGTTAVRRDSVGVTQPLSSMVVRATEYSVGPLGRASLPATLGSEMRYGYAVALTVDGVAGPGTSVEFSQPVALYVENFLDLPVGTELPGAVYAPETSSWVPTQKARVIEVVAASGGLADLDVSGSGSPASVEELAALGIDSEECQQIAALYAAGQELLRAEVVHFSEYHYGVVSTTALPVPINRPPSVGTDRQLDWPAITSYAGLVEVENQVLVESLAIRGTSFSLNYRSDRVPGRKDPYTLSIPLTGSTVPPSVDRIELTIDIAGQRVVRSFSPTPNLVDEFTWNRQEGYGRDVQGAAQFTAQIRYFGGSGRAEAVSERTFGGALGTLDAASALGLGGWTLSGHHFYDAATGTVFYGDGRRQALRSETNNALVLERVAGTGEDGSAGDGGPARKARLRFPTGLSPTSDGGLLIADYDGCRVRKISKDGIISTIAGSRCSTAQDTGDGGPATQARLAGPAKAVEGPGGVIYIADFRVHRVRKIDREGKISTVAGDGVFGCEGNRLAFPKDLAITADGSIVIANAGAMDVGGMVCESIQILRPDGHLETLVGKEFSPDGQNTAFLNAPEGVAVAPDGSIYFSPANAVARRPGGGGFDPQHPAWVVGGLLRNYGSGEETLKGDGLAASSTNTRFFRTGHLAVRSDGAVYVIDRLNRRVRSISAAEVVHTVAGGGATVPAGDGIQATDAALQDPTSVALDPTGKYLYISDGLLRQVWRARLPEARDVGEQVVPEADGSVRYVFDDDGRHLRTEDGISGRVLMRFSYTDYLRPSGEQQTLLTRIEDAYSNATTIERDSQGRALAIVAPFGQRTSLTTDATTGYLSQIAFGVESVQVTHDGGGLLRRLVDPREGGYDFDFDPNGQLTQLGDPAQGSLTLSREESETSLSVRETTALDRHDEIESLLPSYDPEIPSAIAPEELMVRRSTDAAGLVTEVHERKDGTITLTSPDGMVTTARLVPDLLLGELAPYVQEVVTQTPSGLRRVVTQELLKVPTTEGSQDAAAVFGTISSGGRTSRQDYQAGLRTVQATSPEGRLQTSLLDTCDRVVETVATGLEPVRTTYDARGRVSKVSQGPGAGRSTTFTYDSQGYVETITDPLLRTVRYEYDPAGRVTKQILPDLREIQFTYDDNGNLTSLTPPSRPAHAFSYTPVDQVDTYTPPDVLPGDDATYYDYNIDRQLELMTRPDGQTIDPGYDTAGRLAHVVVPTGTTGYLYHPVTGHLMSITPPAGGGGLSYSYDGSLVTQISQTGAIPASIDYAYDRQADASSNFEIASRRINGDESTKVEYQYDRDGLTTRAGALQLHHDPANGLLRGTTLLKTGVAVQRNNFGEVLNYRSGFDDGTCPTSAPPFAGCQLVLEQTFTRDAVGRITEKTETLRDPITQAAETHAYIYTFDPSGRLTEVKRDGAVWETYGYDANSNRTSWTDPWGSGTAAYDAQDRLLTYGDVGYTYTPNGELLTKTQGSASVGYDYDVHGNLRRVTLDNGTVIDYVIDAANRRIGKKINGTLVQGFIYGTGIAPLAETDGSGVVTATFIYGTRSNVPDAMLRGGQTYRFVTDHLGSVRWVLNAQTGQVEQRIDYDVFGRVTLDTAPGWQPFGFAGGLYEVQTGLVRFGARDYEAGVGRWSSKDPIGFAGGDANVYGYVIADPVNLVDPSGRQADRFVGMTCSANGADSDCLNRAAVAARAGLNVGAIAAPLIAGTVLAPEAWGWCALNGPACASVGMLVVDLINPVPGDAIPPIPALSKGAQLAANRLAGNTFRDEIADLLIAEGREIELEVFKRTPFGPRYIDIEVSHNSVVLGGIETKSGASRYTLAQRAKDWWLRNVDNYPVNVVRDR